MVLEYDDLWSQSLKRETKKMKFVYEWTVSVEMIEDVIYAML